MVDVRGRKERRKRRRRGRRIRAERQEKNNSRLDFQSIYWYANQKHDRQTNQFECVYYSDKHWEHIDVCGAYWCAGTALLCVRLGRRNEDWKIIRHTHPKSSHFKRPNRRKIYNRVCTRVHNYHLPKSFRLFSHTSYITHIHCLQSEDLIDL